MARFVMTYCKKVANEQYTGWLHQDEFGYYADVTLKTDDMINQEPAVFIVAARYLSTDFQQVLDEFTKLVDDIIKSRQDHFKFLAAKGVIV